MGALSVESDQPISPETAHNGPGGGSNKVLVGGNSAECGVKKIIITKATTNKKEEK